MKRSLFSLVAGCLVALLIDSLMARPLSGTIFHRPAECTSSRALTETRKASLRPVTCQPSAARVLALQAAGT